jgi:hypothetical protein
VDPLLLTYFKLIHAPQVTEITIEYTKCDEQTPVTSITDDAFHDVSYSRYRLNADHSNTQHSTPQYAYLQSSNQCVIRFQIPYDLDPTVLLYYKLTNFYQNHRRYVKSLNTDQLKGDDKSAGDLESGDCKPLARRDGKPIYPCGLIANSLFNGSPPFPSLLIVFVLIYIALKTPSLRPSKL